MLKIIYLGGTYLKVLLGKNTAQERLVYVRTGVKKKHLL